MRRALTWLLTTLALAALALPAGAQDWKVVRIAVEGAYPPFNEITRDGKFKGFDVDIAHALCAEMKVDCRLVRQTWDQIQDGLLRKDTDAIVSSLSIKESRRERYDFTNKYYHTPAKFVAKKGAAIEISPAGLAGKRVGVQRTTTHEAFLAENYGGGVTLRTFQTLGQATDALAAGEVDLVFADSLALAYGFLKTDKGKGFALVGPDFTDRRWFGEGVGIAVRKEDGDLKERFNRALATILANGTYQKIAERYFGFNIYGG
jgi:arginine/ornithine transport system substrate-binding protein